MGNITIYNARATIKRSGRLSGRCSSTFRSTVFGPNSSLRWENRNTWAPWDDTMVIYDRVWVGTRVIPLDLRAKYIPCRRRSDRWRRWRRPLKLISLLRTSWSVCVFVCACVCVCRMQHCIVHDTKLRRTYTI